MWRCLNQQRRSSRSHESISPAKGSSSGDPGVLPTAGGLSERSVSLRYFLTVGSETPVSRAIEATVAPFLPSLLISSILSTPIISSLAPNRRNRSNDNGRPNGMVGVPALRPETFSCSFPKLHRARTRNTEAIKHNMAQSETSRAWEALMAPIPAPDVVVCDGGTGFERARRRAWPRTRVQRCVFHAFCQVRRYTTSRPRLQAGRELYALSIELMHLETLRQADWWAERYLQRRSFWADFLEDVSIVDGRRVFTHERLRKARSSLSRLVSAGTLFTYLDPALTAEGPLPRTNNPIEGGVNAQLRDMLRNHRGMSSMRRVKAVFWWCYLHAESPKPVREALGAMPTDDDIDLLYRTYSAGPKRDVDVQ